MPIQLTERAAQHIQQTLSKGKGLGLRLGVRPQGCTGFAYVVSIAETQDPADQVFEHHGVKVLVDEKSLPYLKGTEIDFVSKGLNRSFEFNNPNAEHYCGCGESFSLKGDH
jgi:iron-sulfur cluster assembly protein